MAVPALAGDGAARQGWQFGRDRRGDGIAAEILAAADRIAFDAGSESIALHAQTYALPLYERAGYAPYGPTFVEEGIEHVAMEKQLA